MAEEDLGGAAFIDSHAHLADEAFDSDRGDVIRRAKESGAEAIVCIGSGSGAGDVLGAARASQAVAAANPGFIWYTAGVHPHDADGFEPSRDVELIRQHARNGAVAIGECGLDYHYDNSPRDMQRAAFAAQVDLARETGLPLVVHTRDAEQDTSEMIEQAGRSGVRGVMHCFTGSRELAETALAAGWYVSFAGIVTFRKWAGDDVVRSIPAERILAESDSPYLAPVPMRGKRNEPAFVAATVARLGSIRGVSAAEMGRIVCGNARALFKLASV